jgi:hypothetical protein
VQIDEAGNNVLVFDVDNSSSAGRRKAADTEDFPVPNPDIGCKPRVSRAIEHAAAPQDKVERLGEGRSQCGNRKGCQT